MAVKFYYNSFSGNITSEDENNPYFQLLLHGGTGWHGPFNTKQDAMDYYTKNKSSNPGWAQPTDSLLGKVGNATGVTDIVGGLGLSDNNIRSWLIRIGEIVLGLVLVGVGVAKLTGTGNMVSQAVKAKV